MQEKTVLERIQATADRRELSSLYYLAHGQVLLGQMEGTEYGKCTLAVSRKLGFGVTEKSMKEFIKAQGFIQ